MQAIARVNRVFKDKPGGLVVDYLGIAHELKQALATYTENGGKGTTAIPQEEAVATMLEKYEICRGLFHGFDWSAWTTGAAAERLGLLPNAQEHILKQEDGKNRLLKAVTDLSAAFALAVPHDEAMRIRDDVGFFQSVRAVLAKSAVQQHRPEQDLDYAIRQIVSRAVVSDEVVDIFAAAGLKKPDISILSEEFLTEVSYMPQKNLAVELLRKFLNNERMPAALFVGILWASGSGKSRSTFEAWPLAEVPAADRPAAGLYWLRSVCLSLRQLRQQGFSRPFRHSLRRSRKCPGRLSAPGSPWLSLSTRNRQNERTVEFHHP